MRVETGVTESMGKKMGIAHLQDQTPILDKLVEFIGYNGLQFHVPGHKQGRFFPDKLKQILGEQTLAIDIPSLDGITDNTFHSNGCVKLAQELAAALYGAAHTRFLVNGATIGVITAIIAAVSPGQAILLPRNIHRSVVSGLVLSGARPVYMEPSFHPVHSALSVSTHQVQRAFEEHSDIRAVLLTRPTYYGLANDIKAIAEVCHHYHCPLIVDEAHGSHLQFLPKGYPAPALHSGADIVVQSPHKTLGSLTGTAQIHVGHHSLIEIGHLQSMFNMLQSTSPNYILMASLDATRHMMWEQGHALFAEAVKEACMLRDRIDAIPGISSSPLDPQLVEQGYQADPLRLVVNFSGLNLSGFVAAEILDKQYGIGWEMRDNHNVVLFLSPQDGKRTYERLIMALEQVAQTHSTANGAVTVNDNLSVIAPPLPKMELLPREAVFGRKAVVPFEQARGRICGELVTTYPPGIPILCPGEIISPEIIDFCLFLKTEEADIHAADSSLESFVVIDE